MYTDPDGEWIHIAIGALLGGVINLGVKAFQGKINSWGDGFAAFGIGAAAGALGAATGGTAFLGAGGGAAPKVHYAASGRHAEGKTCQKISGSIIFFASMLKILLFLYTN